MARDLFAELIRRPPPPDRVFVCGVCGVELRGRSATFDEHARVTCHDCTGRLVDDDEAPTDADIRALRDEAAAAGDRAMVRICDQALTGNRAARAECARCIAAARALVDDEAAR